MAQLMGEGENMAERHILCIGAHPDDNEFSVGGTAARCAARGDIVHFVSVTNGNKGHYMEEYIANPQALAARRLIEAQNAAAVIGATYQTLNVPDGEVYVTQATTEALIRCIRSCGKPGQGPDLVLFNRPLDYHRDHRYTAQMVLDATYMLTVPMMCPDTRHLDRMPVFAYWYDDFRDTVPFQADIAVPIDDVMEQKTDMVAAHVSQVFEWLPYNAGRLEQVPPPSETAARRNLIAEHMRARGAHRREATRPTLEKWLGASPAQYVEAFQTCEYGRVPDDAESPFSFSAWGIARIIKIRLVGPGARCPADKYYTESVICTQSRTGFNAQNQ